MQVSTKNHLKLFARCKDLISRQLYPLKRLIIRHLPSLTGMNLTLASFFNKNKTGPDRFIHLPNYSQLLIYPILKGNSSHNVLNIFE